MGESHVSDQENKAVPLVEEVAHLEKRAVITGKVTVRTVVDTVTRHLEASLASQTASVERIPVEREISAVPDIRIEGQVTIIPIIEERLFVEKRLVLVEEIRVTLADTVEDIDVPVEVRTQRALIESDKP